MATLSRTLGASQGEVERFTSGHLCLACRRSATEPIWSISIRRKSLQRYLGTAGVGRHAIQLVRCVTCRSVYQSPMLSPSVYAGWYQDPRYDFCRGTAYSNASSEGERHANKVLATLAPLIGTQFPRVLDVGCGSGVFMGACGRRGWMTVGCDPSPHRVHRGNCALPIVLSTFEDAEFGNSMFDLVTCWDVFEHFNDPRCILGKIRRILRDDGLLAIEVPNVASGYSRLLGRRWWYDFEHIFYYSPEGLLHLLSQCGFQVIAIESDNFNLLTREGLTRIGLLGEDAVWGRVGDASPASGVSSSARRFVETYSHGFAGKVANRILAWPNRVLNHSINSRLLGDQLRVFARKPSKSREDITDSCCERRSSV